MKSAANTEIADGFTRFILPLTNLQDLVSKSKGKRNPALFFYQSGARDQLFKLEGLCRIYKSINSKKTFDPLNVLFKQLEDRFGRIDYFSHFLLEFSAQKNIPASFMRYFSERHDMELKTLNDQIREGNLLSGDESFDDIKDTLADVKWDERSTEKRKIIEYISSQIEKLKQQYENGELHFDHIENGVHEFRRKLRWISIYAQSLNGLIRLKKVKLVPEGIQQYLTPEIINSPFNILPQSASGMKPVEIQSPFFYALSWIIEESGKLKDAGLKIMIVNEALKQSDLRKKDAIVDLKKRLLSANILSLREIPEQMERLADKFIYENRVLALIKRDLLRGLN